MNLSYPDKSSTAFSKVALIVAALTQMHLTPFGAVSTATAPIAVQREKKGERKKKNIYHSSVCSKEMLIIVQNV